MFRPPSPLQFNNNSSTNAAAQNQKHVFSVFNSSNNNIETTDPIFRHPSSSSTPTPHDHDSIKSNNTQQHNKQPSQTFNDSSPPTPSNNSGYNIHRDSHSNTFTSLTGPPLAGQANTLINPEIRPLKRKGWDNITLATARIQSKRDSIHVKANNNERSKSYQFHSNSQTTVPRKGYYDNYTPEYYKIRYDATMFPLNDFEGDIDPSIIASPNDIELSAEMQKERKDWLSFLSSVLTGEVIMSEKQRISTSNNRQAANYNYQIWLGIRAATNGRQLSEEKQALDEKKQQVTATLKEVIDFQVQPGDVPAIEQVVTLLQKVDDCEGLYPTRKAMMSEKPLYKSENFQYSIDALNSWLTITRSLQTQLKILQNWTNSENLEITKSADAENPSFLERILKENSLKQIFEKKTLSTLNSLLSKAKLIMIENANAFAKMKLPSYIDELQKLLNFPTKLMEECMRLLIEISSRLTDPTMLMIQQRMDDFRISLILACQIKHQYLELVKPATGWEIPPCINENYNHILLESLKFYLRLLQWKFKGGCKTVFFKEAEILETEWSFLNGICRDIAGGDIEAAEQFCILVNKLHQNVITYYETNLELPKDIDTANITKWYNKILDGVRLRSQLENATEYFIDDDTFPNFIKNLEHTNHVLVYPDTFNEDNVCFIVEQSLKDRQEQIQKLLKAILTPYDQLNSDHEEELNGTEYILILSPRVSFEWNGPIMMVSLGQLNIELKSYRVRLVANGGSTRLQACKQRFRNVVEHCGIKVIVETRANVSSVNREIAKLKKIIVKLINMIIDSVRKIREMTKNLQPQDLIENCFSFATEIGHRCMKFMHRDIARNQLNIKLTHMAIDWVSFICDDCIPNDRKTFRWAVIALEFAMATNRGSNIYGLSEEAFSLLHNKVARCMTLLISHVDILGARSSHEAIEQQEKYEESSKPSSSIKNKTFSSILSSSAKDSLIVREEWIASLNELESRRSQRLQDQRLVGKVLEDQLENRSLVFLASSSSNISLRWQQGKFIGGGTFGSVYLAVNLDTSDLMAVKEIRFQDPSSLSSLYRSVKEEMSVMEMLDHPNIVSYYGIEVHRDKVYIFMEYCQGGSLASQLEHGRIEDENVIKFYVAQMLQGLIYLHENNIVHRDIKPDNILLDHMGYIKFVDFGAAKILAKNQKTMCRTTKTQKTHVNSLTGTPMYMAPEIIAGGEKGRKGSMDIWALGCCILEMATGKRPWSNLDNEWAIMYHVVTGHPPLPDPSQISELGMDFLTQCFVRSAQQRPTAKELIENPWIADVFEASDVNNHYHRHTYSAGSTTSKHPPSL
nr:8256_t:CDS:2 [Entrophospora candida]